MRSRTSWVVRGFLEIPNSECTGSIGMCFVLVRVDSTMYSLASCRDRMQPRTLHTNVSGILGNEKRRAYEYHWNSGRLGLSCRPSSLFLRYVNILQCHPPDTRPLQLDLQENEQIVSVQTKLENALVTETKTSNV